MDLAGIEFQLATCVIGGIFGLDASEAKGSLGLGAPPWAYYSDL